VRLAGEAGLDPEEVRAVLAGDAHADAVRADEVEARENRWCRVCPSSCSGGRYAVSGAQSSEQPARGAPPGMARSRGQAGSLRRGRRVRPRRVLES